MFDFLFSIITPLAYVCICYECRKYKKRAKELEDELERLKNKIAWASYKDM